MDIFRNITVTEIEAPFTVHFPKDRIVQMRDRPWYGLSFCASGQLTYTMSDQQVISDPSNAILLPLGGTYRICGDRTGDFPVINFLCQGLDCREIRSIPLSNPQSCLRDCEALRNLFLFGGSRTKIFSAFYELLSKTALSRPAGENLLLPALAYVESHLSDPFLSNTDLARQARISEVYLRKLFLMHYRTTPKQYILELRIQKAKLLLTEDSLRVTEIAERSGFSSVYHFCKAFKQRTGITPTQYAESNRQQNI